MAKKKISTPTARHGRRLLKDIGIPAAAALLGGGGGAYAVHRKGKKRRFAVAPLGPGKPTLMGERRHLTDFAKALKSNDVKGVQKSLSNLMLGSSLAKSAALSPLQLAGLATGTGVTGAGIGALLSHMREKGKRPNYVNIMDPETGFAAGIAGGKKHVGATIKDLRAGKLPKKDSNVLLGQPLIPGSVLTRNFLQNGNWINRSDRQGMGSYEGRGLGPGGGESRSEGELRQANEYRTRQKITKVKESAAKSTLLRDIGIPTALGALGLGVGGVWGHKQGKGNQFKVLSSSNSNMNLIGKRKYLEGFNKAVKSRNPDKIKRNLSKLIAAAGPPRSVSLSKGKTAGLSTKGLAALSLLTGATGLGIGKNIGGRKFKGTQASGAIIGPKSKDTHIAAFGPRKEVDRFTSDVKRRARGELLKRRGYKLLGYRKGEYAPAKVLSSTIIESMKEKVSEDALPEYYEYGPAVRKFHNENLSETHRKATRKGGLIGFVPGAIAGTLLGRKAGGLGLAGFTAGGLLGGVLGGAVGDHMGRRRMAKRVKSINKELDKGRELIRSARSRGKDYYPVSQNGNIIGLTLGEKSMKKHAKPLLKGLGLAAAGAGLVGTGAMFGRRSRFGIMNTPLGVVAGEHKDLQSIKKSVKNKNRDRFAKSLSRVVPIDRRYGHALISKQRQLDKKSHILEKLADLDSAPHRALIRSLSGSKFGTPRMGGRKLMGSYMDKLKAMSIEDPEHAGEAKKLLKNIKKGRMKGTLKGGLIGGISGLTAGAGLGGAAMVASILLDESVPKTKVPLSSIFKFMAGTGALGAGLGSGIGSLIGHTRGGRKAAYGDIKDKLLKESMVRELALEKLAVELSPENFRRLGHKTKEVANAVRSNIPPDAVQSVKELMGWKAKGTPLKRLGRGLGIGAVAGALGYGGYKLHEHLKNKKKESMVRELALKKLAGWKLPLLGFGAIGGATYLGSKAMGTAGKMVNAHSRRPSITAMNRLRYGSRT